MAAQRGILAFTLLAFVPWLIALGGMGATAYECYKRSGAWHCTASGARLRGRSQAVGSAFCETGRSAHRDQLADSTRVQCHAKPNDIHWTASVPAQRGRVVFVTPD